MITNNDKSIVKLDAVQKKTLERLKGKIKEGIYLYESIPCCICNGMEFQVLSRKDRYGLPNNTVICKRCGLIQINPRMEMKAYLNFYRNEYRNLQDGGISDLKVVHELELRRGKAIDKFLESTGFYEQIKKPIRIFEVGCATGGILEFFHAKGFDVMGCDLDVGYLEYGRKKGLQLLEGTLKDMNFSNEKPDLIIYNHVLEHILNPKEELRLVKDCLKENGFVYIEVPGIKNISGDHFLYSLQLQHVYHFSKKTLENLMKISGFSLIEGNEHVRSLFVKTELGDKKIESQYETLLEWINKMRQRRRLHVMKKLLKGSLSFKKSNLKTLVTSIRKRL